MSLWYQTFKSTHIMPNGQEGLNSKLNELYEREDKAGRITRYAKYNIECDYAIIDSKDLDYHKTKTAIGFGVSFLKNDSDTRKIIIFKDLIKPEFIDMAVAHEFSHLNEKHKNKTGLLTEQFEVDKKNEKEAFSLELKIAKLSKKKQKYLRWIEEEYPHRIKLFKEFGLIDKVR